MAQDIAMRAAAAMPISDMWRLAESVAKSKLFLGIQTAEQALALMAIAQAEGHHPAIAARDYNIIQNRPAKKAEAMQRDFLACGGKIEWHELNDIAAEATFSHPQGGSVRLRWDQERVKLAGLSDKENHRKFPRQMLRSRLVSEGVRTVFPAATSGMYVPEEVVDFGPKDITPISPADDLDQFAAESKTDLEGFVELANEQADGGTDAFRDWWKTLSANNRILIKPHLITLEMRAKKADQRRAPGEIVEDIPLPGEDGPMTVREMA